MRIESGSYCCNHITHCIAHKAPIDFILRGILPDGEEIGFTLIEGVLVQVLHLRSADYGCGQLRNRLYFIAARTDDPSILDQIAHLITTIFKDTHTRMYADDLAQLAFDVVNSKKSNTKAIRTPKRIRSSASWEDTGNNNMCMLPNRHRVSSFILFAVF